MVDKHDSLFPGICKLIQKSFIELNGREKKNVKSIFFLHPKEEQTALNLAKLFRQYFTHLCDKLECLFLKILPSELWPVL